MKRSDLTRLNARIEFIREKHGISKSEFAKRLEISPAYVTALEGGEKTRISAQLAKLIQYEFGVEMRWMLEGYGEPFIPGIKTKSSVAEDDIGRDGAQPGDLSAFERLLSEVSATYINLPIGQLKEVLRDDFRRLTQALGFDSCVLYMSDEPPGSFTKIAPLVWFVDEKQESNRLMSEWLKEKPTIDAKEFHYSFEKWKQGEYIPFVEFDHCPEEAFREKLHSQELGLQSCLSIPLSFAGNISGIIAVATFPVRREWPEELISRLRLLGEVFINALMRKKSEEELQEALSEIRELKERFEADYLYLKEEMKEEYKGVVGKSSGLRDLLVKVRQVAPTNANVLILGETGTGKGLVARAIHDSSSRRDRPLVQVNCAALAPTVIESELFGHEKGAFTGATTRRFGRFEAARGTTLFLDEIGDFPLELQPKLLRVLEEGEFERVGGNSTIHTDIRLIAATSKDLEKEVQAGRFRSDLWYRLNIFPIFVPPLRERLGDIPLFVEYFIEKYGSGGGKKFQNVPVETIELLKSYSWPGNIRELSNVIERAVIESNRGRLSIELPRNRNPGFKDRMTLRDIERGSIIRVLERTRWKIKGPDGAAQYLDIPPETLRSRMKKLDIKRPD